MNSPSIQRVKSGNNKEAKETSRISRNNPRVKAEIATLTGLNLQVKLRPVKPVGKIVTY